MIRITPARPSGTIEVPASKSQTIRAFLIAYFSGEMSIIRHPLISSDTESCIDAIRALGAKVSFSQDMSTSYVDAGNIHLPESIEIDAGNSGTTEYLLLPMAASLGIPVTITGDEQLRRRPLGPLADALAALGASIECNDGRPPVTIKGPLSGGKTSIECRTSQYLSGLLLGSVLAKGDTVIDCPLLFEKPYVSLTLGWLDRQGIEYTISDDYMHSEIKGGQRYHGFDEYITGDYSSASFFFAMAAMAGTAITVKGLDRNDAQGDKAILDILQEMGCMVSWEGNAVTVRGPEKLTGGTFDLNAIPDTLPILAVTAAAAEGTTKLTNVPQARIKETDRIKSMHENLSALGVECEEEYDGLIIHGRGHVAMASLSAAAADDIIIDNEEAAAVTFPSFFRLFDSIRK